MILDYIERTGAYVLRIPRSVDNFAKLTQSLVREHGLNFSTSASSDSTGVLFTKEPYAAATFAEHATDAAKAKLGHILKEIGESWKLHSDIHVACPDDKELWSVQKAGVEYAMRRQHVLLGDEPGVGKTPTAICLANEMRAENVLCIVPANIRLQWAKRISEWSTMRWPYYINPILHGRKGVYPTDTGKPGWNIVSYDLARTQTIGSALAKGRYDLLILDEAHYLKTIDSQRTRAIFGGGEHNLFEPLANKATKIISLTGTPLPNRPREAYTLARALCFDSIDWLSEEKFKERFNPSIKNTTYDKEQNRWKVWVDERSGRHAELQNRLRANFMVRRLLHDALPQLRLPVYDLVYLEETGAIRQALQAESLLDIDPENLQGADMTTLGHISIVRRMMGVAMAPQVADYIDMLIRGGETKLVLFAWHHEVMDILETRLEKHGLIRIDGRTSAAAKERLVNQFVTDTDTQIALGHLQAMGLGTDGLQQVSHHALIAEPSWVPGDNVQAFRRLVRAGQQRTVQGDLFVVQNSFAERLLATALRKLNVTDKALDRTFALG